MPDKGDGVPLYVMKREMVDELVRRTKLVLSKAQEEEFLKLIDPGDRPYITLDDWYYAVGRAALNSRSRGLRGS
jgi:hypothetical protein